MWIRNFKRYDFAANSKDDSRKQALLLNLAGGKVVQVFDILSSADALVCLLSGALNMLYRVKIYYMKFLHPGNADNEMSNHSRNLFKVETPFIELRAL